MQQANEVSKKTILKIDIKFKTHREYYRFLFKNCSQVKFPTAKHLKVIVLSFSKSL